MDRAGVAGGHVVEGVEGGDRDREGTARGGRARAAHAEVGGRGATSTVTLWVPVMPEFDVSVAVTVWEPAVTRVTPLVKVWTPLSPP